MFRTDVKLFIFTQNSFFANDYTRRTVLIEFAGSLSIRSKSHAVCRVKMRIKKIVGCEFTDWCNAKTLSVAMTSLHPTTSCESFKLDRIHQPTPLPNLPLPCTKFPNQSSFRQSDTSPLLRAGNLTVVTSRRPPRMHKRSERAQLKPGSVARSPRQTPLRMQLICVYARRDDANDLEWAGRHVHRRAGSPGRG